MTTTDNAAVDQGEAQQQQRATPPRPRGWLRGLSPMARRIVRIAVVLIAAVALIAVVGTFWVVDRFVIAHVEIADVAAYEAEINATISAPDVSGASATSTSIETDVPTDESTGAVLTDDSYVSEGASITIEEVSIGSGDDRITYYVANVVLSDATSLQSAFAKDNGAVFAINGDYYGFRDTGIVIRNGIAYRDEGAEPVSPSTETGPC